jgi:hypothetical protein
LSRRLGVVTIALAGIANVMAGTAVVGGSSIAWLSTVANRGNPNRQEAFCAEEGALHTCWLRNGARALERVHLELNRRGFPSGREYDSRCMLEVEASMHGTSIFA